MKLDDFLNKFIEMKHTSIYIRNMTNNISDYYTLEELEKYDDYEVDDFQIFMKLNKIVIDIRKDKIK